MQEYIQSLSQRTEFVIVVLVAFGYFILGSILSVLTPSHQPAITGAHLRFLIVYELVVMAALLSFLYLRSWDLQQVGFSPSIKEKFVGVGLALGAYVANLVIWLLALNVTSGADQVIGGANLIEPGLSIAIIIAVSIVNPVFEEIFVCGYVISSLKTRRGFWVAINASVFIRLIYHLYQGAVGVIGIISLGLIFAYWYARSGRIWPLIIAHAVFDFFGLLAYSGQ